MDHVLIALGLAALWALFVYLSPTKACSSCARHKGPCPRCAGTGSRFRFGAPLVRRAVARAYRELRHAAVEVYEELRRTREAR